MFLTKWKIALVAAIFFLINSKSAKAEEISIFDMRKNIPLSDQEKVYKDYFLSKGAAAGLRPGMILTVKRKIPYYDTIHNRTAGDLNVPVGRIRVIQADRDLAVARQYSAFSREDMPMLEDNFIMIGDEVDLSSATTESKLKGKSAETVPDSGSKEKSPESADNREFKVDFASQTPDNTALPVSVDGPVVQ